jgi:hypothetical protein
LSFRGKIGKTHPDIQGEFRAGKISSSIKVFTSLSQDIFFQSEEEIEADPEELIAAEDEFKHWNHPI